MKKFILLFFLISVLIPIVSSAQAPQEAWVARYNGTGNNYDEANAIAVDDYGNVYVTGESKGSGTGLDYVTIKYDPNGNVLWTVRYNGYGSGDDRAVAIAVDDLGNVYVTGESKGSSAGYDYATIKYGPSGNMLWVVRYNGSGNSDDRAHGLAVDASGNIYVTGESKGNSSSLDYATIKYNSNGNQLWVQRYDGPVHYNDAAYAIAVDINGNVYVTGESKGSGTCLDYATIKYDINGNQKWVKRYNNSANSDDSAYALAIDGFGNIYVTGKSKSSAYYYDYATIKYNTAGNELWIKTYNGTGNGDDKAHAIAVDNSGNVYVTGESKGNGTNKDYATVKYDTNGNTLWIARYNGPKNNDDSAYAIAIDNNENVYVTGGSVDCPRDYATVKYDSNGNLLWVARYNGPSDGDDVASAIAVDNSRNVYVTGKSQNSTTYVDYLTIKYSELSGDFSANVTSGYRPLTVQFTDESTGIITSWSWDFGDGGTSTDQNPIHTYTTAGDFTVTLTVTGPGGSDTIQKTGYIHVDPALPSANFHADQTGGIGSLTVQFIDDSTGDITGWLWDFGDGGTSTEQNPSHEYTTPGTFTVSLTAAGPSGTDTETKTDFIHVYNPSSAHFSGSPTGGTLPMIVQFTDNSTGDITSWLWDFGDGGTSTDQNPAHTYTSAGSFTVILTVSGPGGTDTETKTNYIVVHVPSSADFSGTPTSGPFPLTVQFTDNSTGDITSWLWDFGDGGTSTEKNPSHIYTYKDNFTVTLTVSGPGGTNTEIKIDYIVTFEPPAANFSASPTSGCRPLTVLFNDLSTGDITGWLWEFGDGEASTEENPSHTYTATGTFTVKLTVSGPGGTDSDTKTDYIIVYEPQTADFHGNPTSGIAPLTVQFTDDSTGDITGWLWDFGDGGTSALQNPSHIYTNASTYTVTLTVTGHCYSDTETKTDYIQVIEPPPVAQFSANQTIVNKNVPVIFHDESTGNITDWLWDFGDGSTSAQQNPSHAYTSTGNFTVTLTVSGPGGSDSEIKVGYITVNECNVRVPQDYPTIQSAIDASDNGCTILVSTGTYAENINFLGKAIRVKGIGTSGPCGCPTEGSSKVAISGNYSGSAVTFNTGETRDSILEGFTIKSGMAPAGGGIYIDDASPTITDCYISENLANEELAAAFGGGIYVTGSNASPLIFNNMIVSNTAQSMIGEAQGGGIYVANGANPTIQNCTIAGNHATLAGGIFISSSASLQAIDSIIWNNNFRDLYCETGCSMDVTYSNVGEDVPGIGNISKEPLFVYGSLGSYYLSHVRAGQDKDSPCIDSGSTLSVISGLDIRNTANDGITDRGKVDMGYHYVPTPVSILDAHPSDTTFNRGETVTHYVTYRIEGNPETLYKVRIKVNIKGAYKDAFSKLETHYPGEYTIQFSRSVPYSALQKKATITYKAILRQKGYTNIVGTDTKITEVTVQ